MPARLLTLARRRPGLVLLAALYVVIAVLVARTPSTVALCTVLFGSLALQLAMATRKPAADRPVPPSPR